MDITDTLLSALEVRVDPFAICDVRDGCYLDLAADEFTSIHYVLSGSGKLTAGSAKPIDIRPNQMIVIPSGITQRIESSHADNISSGSESVCLQPSEDLNWLRAGEGEGDNDIVLACGRVHVSYGQKTELFSLLEFPLVQSFDGSGYIRGAFEEMLREFCRPQLGTLALTSVLMKQCLIMLIRRLQEQQDWRVPWLAVLDNRGLQNALKAILESPEKNHKVEDLADLACMSRSAFTEQFNRSMGQPPHEFLSNYRMRKAANFLKTTDLAVGLIAEQVGYQSRSSFSRAFKALYDVDPVQYRARTPDWN